VRFTRAEFDTMVREVLCEDAVSFDMLCRIAEKTLRSTVRYWAQTDPCLKGRDYENDLMQEIHMKLIQHTAVDFLLNDRAVGAFNDDPEGFEDWMFTVARRHKSDFVNKVRSQDNKEGPIENVDKAAAPESERELQQERVETLRTALAAVLDAKVGVYKVLTWLAQSVFILDRNIPKIKTNDMIVDTFENRTLGEMYEMIQYASREIPWLSLTPAQDAKLRAALEKPWKDGRKHGDVTYKSFFMKHNGVISGKKSISDWMNRMNDMIKRKMGDTETPPEEKPKNEEKGAEE